MITTRDRIVGFFLRAPEEELTRQDMCERWDLNDHAVWDATNRMRADGLLSIVRRGRKYIYTPTPLLLSLGDAVR